MQKIIKHRITAATIGLLILTAYSILGTGDPNAKLLGMSLEIISGTSVIGIALLMYPYLKPYSKKLSLGYLLIKMIEGSLAIIAGILFYIHSASLLAIREIIYLIHGYVFAIPALILYYLFYQSKLVPGWLSIWGIIASLLLIGINILELLISHIPQNEILYLPIVANEIVLAVWLIIKGFNLRRA